MEGTPFGRYRLVELLGRGGMGEVWRAFDTAMNRVVALKVLPENLADDAQYQTRFRREAQAAASLDEPHIVPIHDFGEIDGRDGEVFAEPSRFDVGREPNRHLGFGSGVHFCLGAALARMEIDTFFSQLIPRLTSIEVAGEVKFSPTTFVGGLKHLPLRYAMS